MRASGLVPLYSTDRVDGAAVVVDCLLFQLRNITMMAYLGAFHSTERYDAICLSDLDGGLLVDGSCNKQADVMEARMENSYLTTARAALAPISIEKLHIRSDVP